MYVTTVFLGDGSEVEISIDNKFSDALKAVHFVGRRAPDKSWFAHGSHFFAFYGEGEYPTIRIDNRSALCSKSS